MCLVPNQTTDKITELFANHFKKIAPAGVQVEVRPHHGGGAGGNPYELASVYCSSQSHGNYFW